MPNAEMPELCRRTIDRMSLRGGNAAVAIRPLFTPSTKNAPQQNWSALLSFFFAGEPQKIIRGHLEEIAEHNDISYTGFKFTALDVGYFTLCHIHRFRKLGLIQVTVFPQIPDPFS